MMVEQYGIVFQNGAHTALTSGIHIQPPFFIPVVVVVVI